VFGYSHHFVEDSILLYLKISGLSLSNSKVSSLIGQAVHLTRKLSSGKNVASPMLSHNIAEWVKFKEK